MKYLTLLLIMTYLGCANHRPPEKINENPVAYDSFGEGDVQASAIKYVGDREVCFDVDVKLRGATFQSALPRNWSLAWVDHKNQYHLLTLNQRDPASVPKGLNPPKHRGHMEWSNTFRTCDPKARLDDVKGIVLTPKELPFEDKRSLRLDW